MAKSLTRQIYFLKKKQSKKALHHFRVLHKRLKALITLLEEIRARKSGTKRFLRKLNKRFKLAGKIRDNQVQHEVLKEFGVTKVRKLNRKSRSDFLKSLKKLQHGKMFGKIEEKVESSVGKRNNSELTSSILNFSRKEIQNALKIARSKNLHSARNRLKIALFCLEIIPDDPEAKALIATIDPIARKIGRWHDCIITHKMVLETKETNQKTSPPEAVQAIESETIRLKQQITRDLTRLGKIIDKPPSSRQNG